MAGIEKTDLTVLVVRRALTGRGDLDRVILSRTFDHEPEFRGVVADDFRQVVGPGVDKARPGAGIRTRVERRQSGDPDRGNLLVGQLRAGKQVRERQPVRGAIAACAAGRIEVDGPRPI